MSGEASTVEPVAGIDDSGPGNRYTPASVPRAGYDSSRPATDRISRPGALTAQPFGLAKMAPRRSDKE
jgi:hypothetical protein